jgi:hypothetical protein
MIIFGTKLTWWHFKAIKAIAAFVALGLILGVVYTQHQPYKYIISHQALEKAFLQEDVKETVINVEGMWKWFIDVVDRAK